VAALIGALIESPHAWASSRSAFSSAKRADKVVDSPGNLRTAERLIMVLDRILIGRAVPGLATDVIFEEGSETLCFDPTSTMIC